MPAAWAVVRMVETASDESEVASFHGARLGMTPADVRDRFDLEGELRASVGPEGAYALELEHATGTVHSARFEFHQGVLVAIRAELDPRDPWAGDEGLFTTDSTVRRTSVSANGTIVMVLIARDCPTHADEVRRLLSGGSPSVPLH